MNKTTLTEINEARAAIINSAIDNQSTAYTTQITMILPQLSSKGGMLSVLVDQLTKADN